MVDSSFTEALRVFHKAAEHVPAYRDFLAIHKVQAKAITTPEQFSTVPAITKENYLKKYPLKELLWNGDFLSATTISMSSGSSGHPFSWLRGDRSRQDSAKLHEAILLENFDTKNTETLAVIGFAMGTWIAGTYTYTAFQDLADQGHKIVSVTPGINIPEIVTILRDLSPLFSQTLLCGYPPFIKDALDVAVTEGIDLPSLNIKLVLAGESISENWRKYVHAKLGAPVNETRSILVYGTADAGMLGRENPLSIATKQLAAQQQDTFETLFPEAQVLPTLAEYDPTLRYFEQEKENLLFTVDNSLPLIRYQINDQGRLISGKEIIAKLPELAKRADLAPYIDRPYVAIYGRSDIAAVFYALNIYPEHIKYGLECPELQEILTGKFQLQTQFDEDQQQTLHLLVEIKPYSIMNEEVESIVRLHAVESLLHYNSEYRRLYQEMSNECEPIIHLLEHGSPEFIIKVKQKWTVVT